MAYAAVISLLGAVDGLLHSHYISIGSSTRKCLKSVHDHATSLAITLENCSEGVGSLEEEVIIEEARRLEDSIEFPLSSHILLLQTQIDLNLNQLRRHADSFAQTARKMKGNIEKLWKQPVKKMKENIKDLWKHKKVSEIYKIGQSTLSLNLDADSFAQTARKTARKMEENIEELWERKVSEIYKIGQPTFSLNLDADSFAQTATKMKEKIEELREQKVSEMIEAHAKELFVPKTEEEVSSATDECDMVGLLDQFLFIRDKLMTKRYANKWYENVIWISGMAGIGKTRLAKKLLQDPSVKAHFECVAFVRVGPVFRPEEVLDSITAQLNLHDQKMIMEESFDERFRRIVSLRKYLIVFDDVWNDMNFLMDILLSRLETQVLVTSRAYVGTTSGFLNLKMRFMDEEESWELLRRNVFGEEECPPQLVKPGKKIANNCEGLPLLINAVAPILLSEAQKDPECWNRVAEKPHSVLEKASHQISEVLLSSYHPLTEYQKLCFLYLAAFPLKYVVRRSTIINFWHVERLHCTWSYHYSFTYEKLLQNNLFMSHEENLWSGRISEACSLHCAYWYVSKRIAENNKFLYTINGRADALDECVKSHRRLAIYENILFAIKEVHEEISSISTVRSLQCTGPYHQYQVPICTQWKVLRVLNAVTIRFYEFPVEVLKLILLRYLAVTCNADLPASISKLWNLEFLIVRQHSGIKRVGVESYVPVEVWDLQKLEHLEIMGRNLHDPPRPGVVLPNLERLLDVGVKSCTKAVLKRLPCLEKLRIQIEFAPNATETMSWFDHISCLDSLKSFHSLIINPTLLRVPPTLAILPSRLEKLTLSGFGYPWEHMRKICELRLLFELKLQHYAFRGEKWDAKVIRFPVLRSLTIEDTDLVEWTAEDQSLCNLNYIAFRNCYKLREIPCFPKVEDIKLVDCNPLAETCAKQKYPGVNWHSRTEKVAYNYSWK